MNLYQAMASTRRSSSLQMKKTLLLDMASPRPNPRSLDLDLRLRARHPRRNPRVLLRMPRMYAHLRLGRVRVPLGYSRTLFIQVPRRIRRIRGKEGRGRRIMGGMRGRRSSARAMISMRARAVAGVQVGTGTLTRAAAAMQVHAPVLASMRAPVGLVRGLPTNAHRVLLRPRRSVSHCAESRHHALPRRAQVKAWAKRS
ncbi:hypothetical protein PENSPDRAFT_448391 [Peniophora sp. CONT]|nr:hypothetical protein PENSPDRAFT_448391 [Peniophora sp. CONT]